jgi:glycine cleavage system H protein
MEIAGYEYPPWLYYDQHHSYAHLGDDLVIQGVTNLAQGMLGEILYVELPYIGRKVQQGERFLSVQSMHPLMRARRIRADIVNRDPYRAGWVVKIQPSDLTELENLLQESNPVLKEWAAKELEAHRLEKLRLDGALGLWPQKSAEPQWVEKKSRVTVPIPAPTPRAT